MRTGSFFNWMCCGRPLMTRWGKTLRRAKDAGQPYHVVHFDGHGAFGEIGPLVASVANPSDGARISPHSFDAAAIYPKTKREGKHGYLCFENPDHPENLRFVDGEDIGNLLAEAGVPVLVFNACRSAHAEAPPEPEKNPDGAGTDPHVQSRAFGSLAQEIVNAGTAGVVAMRYNVYVVTAAEIEETKALIQQLSEPG